MQWQKSVGILVLQVFVIKQQLQPDAGGKNVNVSPDKGCQGWLCRSRPTISSHNQWKIEKSSAQKSSQESQTCNQTLTKNMSSDEEQHDWPAWGVRRWNCVSNVLVTQCVFRMCLQISFCQNPFNKSCWEVKTKLHFQVRTFALLLLLCVKWL